jgi:hypothetical protein
MQIMNASHLTVRNIPDEIASALEREKQRRRTSLNQTVIDLLKQSLGVGGVRSNGLSRLAGTWSEAEHRDFLAAIEPLNELDPDLWK